MSEITLKTKIEKTLSEILTDKYDCKVTIRFEPAQGEQKITHHLAGLTSSPQPDG
jgi:hypothetical protein